MMRKMTFGILLVCMLSCLTGCGAKTDPVVEENSDDDEYVWEAAFLNIGEDYESSVFDVYGFDMGEGQLTYALRPFSLVKPLHKCVVNLQTMEQTDTPIGLGSKPGEDSRAVGQVGFDGKGFLHMLYQVVPGGMKPSETKAGESRVEYRIYGENGEVWKALDVTDALSVKPGTVDIITHCCAMKEGGIICFLENQQQSRLIAISETGELRGEIDLTGANLFDLVAGDGGEVYLLLQKAGEDVKLVKADLDSSEILQTYTGIPTDVIRISGYQGDGLLLVSGQVLYGFSFEGEQIDEILKWDDYSINGESICFARRTDEKNIYVGLSNGITYAELAHLTLIPKSEVKEKEKIVLAALGDNSLVQNRIKKYNRYNDRYIVEYRQMDEGEDYDSALKEFNQLILGEDCPDLLVLSSQLDIEDFAANGVFEDLSPYLEKSRRVKREEFAENVLQAYTRSGKLLCIPSSFSISEAVVGKQSLAEEGFGRDIRDYQELTGRYPDSRLFESTNCRTDLLHTGWKSFVDFESGKCRFDSRDFLEFLEWVKTYPSEIDNTVHPLERYQSGEILFRLTPIFGVDGYWINIPVFGEQVSLFPYPGSDSAFIWSDDTYAITANSRHKEGAWDFIESCIRHRNLSDYYDGFPVRKDMRKELFDLFMEKRYKTDEAGNILYDEATGEPVEERRGIHRFNNVDFSFYSMTKEQIDVLEAFLNQPLAAREIANNREKEMYLIFNEEVQPYLLGQKSAEDVAKIIQSRLQLYLDEG